MQETSNRKSSLDIAGEYGQIVGHINDHGPTSDLELSVTLGIPINRVTKNLLKAIMAKAIHPVEPVYRVILAKTLPALVREQLNFRDTDLIRIDCNEDGSSGGTMSVIETDHKEDDSPDGIMSAIE